MSELVKKRIKTIKVELDKCNGCRACEIACAAFHATPKYSSFNPSRSRIRMVIDERKDEWVAVRATNYSVDECAGRRSYMIHGKEYSQCSFCGTVCPARNLFKEPDSGLPLKCDMCGDDPEQIPLCVQMCSRGALTYCDREEVIEDDREVSRGELEEGVHSLLNQFGPEKIKDYLNKKAKKDKTPRAKGHG